MPRVENLGDNVTEFCQKSGNGSSTFDVCNDCASKLEDNSHAFPNKLQPYNGDPVGTEGYGGDVEHLAYNELKYSCAVCGKKLKDKDN